MIGTRSGEDALASALRELAARRSVRHAHRTLAEAAAVVATVPHGDGRVRAAPNLDATAPDVVDAEAHQIVGPFGVRGAILPHGSEHAGHGQRAVGSRLVGQAEGTPLERSIIDDDEAFHRTLKRSPQETESSSSTSPRGFASRTLDGRAQELSAWHDELGERRAAAVRSPEQRQTTLDSVRRCAAASHDAAALARRLKDDARARFARVRRRAGELAGPPAAPLAGATR
ncbi:hypothetical protein [Actinomycetospora flava]|uniref:Uncharacterized protein n=1 Tax=Actinomycetospora flava TaxID=3129232 RepID=A0ABU8M8D6_9PSEU